MIWPRRLPATRKRLLPKLLLMLTLRSTNLPVWGTCTCAPDASDPNMLAPNMEPPYREANSTGPLPRLAVGVLVTLCAAKLLLHLFTSARHHDWGYVDAAPLIAVYAKIALWMGGSLAALRILPALAGTALVALTMLI